MMKHTIPASFLDSLEGAAGFEKKAFQEVHLANRQISSVRFNPNKSFNTPDSNLEIQSRIPWSTHGFYLSSRPSFTLDPLFHAGAYYVQEASSMFLEQVLRQSVDLNVDMKVLDLCAAPGGKSTQIQSLLSPNSMLVSNEVIKSRVHVLAENLTKWGGVNTVVTNNDPSDFQRLEGFFDIVVVDAPCSGSGMFRKDPQAIEEWSLENVALCSQRQQRILADVLPALKENGLLVYSTCSYSEAENEQITDWLLMECEMQPVKIEVHQDWKIIEVSTKAGGYGYRFYPDKLDGEGFFISAFRKAKQTEKRPSNPKRQTIEWLSAKQTALLVNWIHSGVPLCYFKWNDRILAVPHTWKEDIFLVQSALYIRQIGIHIGQLIRDEMNPSHAWSVSQVASEILPSLEWEKQSALDFLRLSTNLPSVEAKGWVMIRYGGLNIGLIKSMSNRINNYYPREWRIVNK